MPEEPAKHANVEMIPQDQFDQIKGLYFYASHRLLKFIAIIREAQREYDENGQAKKYRTSEFVQIKRSEAEEMESLLVDLEDRLDKMFLRHDRLVEVAQERQKNKIKIPRKIVN